MVTITKRVLGLWIIFGSGACHAAAATYPYHVARVEASSFDQPILSSDVSTEASAPSSPDALPADRTTQARLEKLLQVYAERLQPSSIPPDEVSALVEQQMQHYYRQGMTREALQAHLGVHSIEEARQKLTDRVTQALAYQRFAQRIGSYTQPTPAQVVHFYHVHLAKTPPHVPAHVTLRQLVYYPNPGSTSCEGPMEAMTTLYQTLVRMGSGSARRRALLQAMQQVAPYASTYGYVLNNRHMLQLTLEEVPQGIRQAALAIGVTALTPDMIIPPHRFTDSQGYEGVRLVLVETYVPAHALTLAEDYDAVVTLWCETHRATGLKRWWDYHVQETEYYGS